MGNYHEGEVENISIVLVPTDGTLVPALAGYAKHFKGSVTPWENVRKYMDETRITRHPVVYVASGSHASFFSPCAVETPFGLGIDRTYHEGAGYWFGLDAGDATYSLEVLPAVDEVGPDDSFGWLRFRGRYGDTFLVSGGSWLNCSPFLFPYVRYPRISLRAPWIAGSGANRWIDPGSELEFCAAFGLLLGYDLAPLPFRVDTHRLAVRRAGADIHLTGIDVEYGQAFPMPLEEIRFYYQAQNGDWLSCGRYDPRREPPPELVVPASNVNGQTTRFFVCDAISTAVQRKPPLPPDAHYGTAEYLRSAQFSVALNGLATVAPAPQAATPEPIGEAVPQGIERLAITGPPLLPGGGTAHYRCLAFYTGDRVADATRQALWNLGENPVAGTTLLTNALTAGFVLSNTPVRVTAVYANKMAACDVMLTGADADRDGLSDQYEAHKGTSPNNPDTDGDGIYDAQDPKPQ
jgi:hypothetical protein